MKSRAYIVSVFFPLLLLLSVKANAFESFVVGDFRVEGLQRISLGTTFTYLPIKVGEEVTAARASASIRALFKTGFFNDIWFTRDGDVLVIHVVERPSISKIDIFGNQEIGSEELRTALKDLGLTEGRVFNRSLLDRVEQELLRQYFNLGKYGVKIDTTIRDLERNRVEIEIDIKEGDAAEIRQIKIIGANAFSEEDLLDRIELTMYSQLFGADSYSKQQLVGDLETLRSFYLDRGYINFNIDSTQVSISPDKHNVYITINITEGEQFYVDSVKVSGETGVPLEDIQNLIGIKQGDVFSRRVVIDTTNRIVSRLGIDGYAFAKVNPIPDVNNETKKVGLTFFIDPGNRVYVRRINISGNTKTRDEVIRRELRQMEGGWISTPLIDRSKIRLQRLGFFEDVKVSTPKVPGTSDQVDVNFEVTEGSTGTFTAGLGYGQEGGFLFNTSITLNNYLGTGKRVALEVNNSEIRKIYSFSLREPYYTDDGISRSFQVFSRETDASEANLADYNTNDIGARITYGVPFSEFVSASGGFGVEQTELEINEDEAPEVYTNWALENDLDVENTQFDTFSINGALTYDSRNRAIFPDKGLLARWSVETALPGGDLEYYKTTLRLNWYYELAPWYTIMFGGEVATGDGYGDTKNLPFFENFYAGGTRSVRGFKGNTIGPKAIECDDGFSCEPGEAVGGDGKFLGRVEFFFPSPFTEEQSRNFRLSLFSDFGKVFSSYEDSDTVVEDDRLRASYGIAAVWITPVGALTFSFAWPYISEEGDETEVFGFNIGAPF